MQFSTITIALLAGLTQAYEIALFSEAGWAGQQVSYEIDGNHQLGFEANSWEFISGWNDGCCVRFCYEGNPVGWRCKESRNYRSSSPIDEVAVGCGETDLLEC